MTCKNRQKTNISTFKVLEASIKTSKNEKVFSLTLKPSYTICSFLKIGFLGEGGGGGLVWGEGMRHMHAL